MNRFTHTPERPSVAPPGGEANVSATATRAELGRLTTGRSPTEIYRRDSSPPGDAALSPTTSPRLRRTKRYTPQFAAGLLTASLALTGCGSQKKEAQLAQDTPAATAHANPNKPVAVNTSEPLPQKNWCDPATDSAIRKAIAAAFQTSDTESLVCQPEDSGGEVLAGGVKMGASWTSGEATAQPIIEYHKNNPGRPGGPADMGEEVQVGNTTVYWLGFDRSVEVPWAGGDYLTIDPNTVSGDTRTVDDLRQQTLDFTGRVLPIFAR